MSVWIEMVGVLAGLLLAPLLAAVSGEDELVVLEVVVFVVVEMGLGHFAAFNTWISTENAFQSRFDSTSQTPCLLNIRWLPGAPRIYRFR